MNIEELQYKAQPFQMSLRFNDRKVPRFILHHREIEDNIDKEKSILEMPPLSSIKEV